MVNALRSNVKKAPLLVISDRSEEELVLRTLAAGAGQVVSRVTSPRLMAAQLHRWIDAFQSRQKDDSGPLQVGPLWLDPRQGFSLADGVDIKLTATEFEVLLLLATSVGELVHRETIGRTLRFISTAEKGGSADMHISRIRRKLKTVGATGVVIVTVHGQGYVLRLAAKQPGVPHPAPLVEWSV